MAEHSYENLVAELQRYEQELQGVERELRAVQHTLKNAETRAVKRLLEVKVIQALSATRDRLPKMYQLACRTIVQELGWDSALVLNFTNEEKKVAAAYQVTQQQREHLETYLGEHPLFAGVHGKHKPFVSYHASDTTALALRSLFHTDEVVAMPILFEKQFYGYVVACAHTKKNSTRDNEDIQFLATLATQLGYITEHTTD